jgi:hypothetical protein
LFCAWRLCGATVHYRGYSSSQCVIIVVYALTRRPTDTPRRNPGKEQEPTPYHVAAHYTDEHVQDSARAYSQAQQLIATPGILLSAYRFEYPPVAPGWFVAVLGETPPEEIQARLLAILSAGEPATLPDKVRKFLEQRRAQASQIAPWVEGHYRPGKRHKLRAPELDDSAGLLLPTGELFIDDEG